MTNLVFHVALLYRLHDATMTDVLETVPVLLANVNLSEYDNMLATESLVGLENVMIESRPALLQHLKQRGITSLAHRQKIANALAKARRAGRLPANPVADAALVLRNDLAMTSGSGHPITITGKTDGFGAQLHAQMSGIAFAIANGRTYQHTPMGPKMDHLAPGEAPADYDEFGGMGLRSPPATPMAEVHEYVAEVHNGDTHACDHYYSEPVCALLRRKYDDAPKPPLPVGLVLDGFIACHIRRGDVGADANTTRYTPNAVYGELLPLLAWPILDCHSLFFHRVRLQILTGCSRRVRRQMSGWSLVAMCAPHSMHSQARGRC